MEYINIDKSINSQSLFFNNLDVIKKYVIETTKYDNMSVYKDGKKVVFTFVIKGYVKCINVKIDGEYTVDNVLRKLNRQIGYFNFAGEMAVHINSIQSNRINPTSSIMRDFLRELNENWYIDPKNNSTLYKKYKDFYKKEIKNHSNKNLIIEVRGEYKPVLVTEAYAINKIKGIAFDTIKRYNYFIDFYGNLIKKEIDELH